MFAALTLLNKTVGKNCVNWYQIKFKLYKDLKVSSRGGLVVELWTDNSLPSTTVGSNLRQVFQNLSRVDRSMVAHWYVICFITCRFVSRFVSRFEFQDLRINVQGQNAIL